MSKKSKLKKTLVEQILDKEQIPHQGLAINALDKTERTQLSTTIYKTLALSGDKSGPIIGIVPIDSHLSEKKLAKVSGNKKVQMIPQKDLQKTTGYVHGANNPVGIWQNKHFPIYIDQIALESDTMIVSAGEIGRSISINPKHLADFVSANFADIQTKTP